MAFHLCVHCRHQQHQRLESLPCFTLAKTAATKTHTASFKTLHKPMDFLLYLQQLAKLSDGQIAALRQSHVQVPTDLRKWSIQDVDDLLQGSDPEHLISSRNWAKLERVLVYIQQKNKLVPGKTHWSHILAVVGDDHESEDVMMAQKQQQQQNDDDESSSVLYREYEEGEMIQEVFPLPVSLSSSSSSTPRLSRGVVRQQSTQSIGWGCPSTTAGSEFGGNDNNDNNDNGKRAQQPSQRARRGGRRVQRAAASLIHSQKRSSSSSSSAKYSSEDLESCDTRSSASEASPTTRQHSFSHDHVDGIGWETSMAQGPCMLCANACLALTLGMGIGAGLAVILL